MGDLKMNNMVYQRTSYKTILYYENRKTLSKVCKSMQLQKANGNFSLHTFRYLWILLPNAYSLLMNS